MTKTQVNLSSETVHLCILLMYKESKKYVDVKTAEKILQALKELSNPNKELFKK